MTALGVSTPFASTLDRCEVVPAFHSDSAISVGSNFIRPIHIVVCNAQPVMMSNIKFSKDLENERLRCILVYVVEALIRYHLSGGTFPKSDRIGELAIYGKLGKPVQTARIIRESRSVSDMKPLSEPHKCGFSCAG